jgi:hypothetical protein
MNERFDQRAVELMIRCFGGAQLSGEQLAQIRHSVCGLSVDQVAKHWNIPKRRVAAMEKDAQPDIKTCDAYRGLLMGHLFLAEGQNEQNRLHHQP